jgi:hypothetical protein
MPHPDVKFTSRPATDNQVSSSKYLAQKEQLLEGNRCYGTGLLDYSCGVIQMHPAPANLSLVKARDGKPLYLVFFKVAPLQSRIKIIVARIIPLKRDDPDASRSSK